jgi:UbiD family decarboxylase
MTDLREFIQVLEDDGDLIRIREPLSIKFEIPSVLKRFESDKALLFENVKNYDGHIIGGICGNRFRILKGLNVKSDELYGKLQSAIKNPTPCEILNDCSVKENIVDDPKLSDFPILTQLYAKSPNDDIENVSFHRLLVLDEKRMGIRIVPRHLYRIKQMAEEAGESSIDVSISIGLPPAVLFATALPASFGVFEFDIANTLLEGDLRLTQCHHIDALAPADAELVLEGKLRLDCDVMEGPFVDLSGTYDVERMQPVVELVGAMHRKNYFYQALLPSGAEHRLLMGMPREVRIWEYVRNVVPTVRGVNMTLGGVGWLHCVVSFEKFREGDPKNVLMAIFASHPSLKHAVVVDSDIDPHDMEQVEWAIATRFRGDEDLLVIPNVRVSSLDPVSDQERELGCKVGVDATKPLNKEGFSKPIIPISDDVKKLLEKINLKFS